MGTITDDDGRTLYVTAFAMTYYQGRYVQTEYPERYWTLTDEGQTLSCYAASYEFGIPLHTGDWEVEWSYDYKGSYYRGEAARMYYCDMAGNLDGGSFYLSQTLFNTDDKYEWISPVFEVREESYEYDEDSDGIIDTRATSSSAVITGFQVVSEGNVISSIEFPEGLAIIRDEYDITCLQMGDKRYLVLSSVYDLEGDIWLLFYRIDASANSLEMLRKQPSTRLYPTVIRHNQSFTITLDEPQVATQQPTEVIATGMDGREHTVATIPAGQSSAQVSATRLHPGVQQVTLRRGSTNIGSHRVMVR